MVLTGTRQVDQCIVAALSTNSPSAYILRAAACVITDAFHDERGRDLAAQLWDMSNEVVGCDLDIEEQPNKRHYR